jgi:hypothetical protein
MEHENQNILPIEASEPDSHPEDSVHSTEAAIAVEGLHSAAPEGGYRNGDSVIVTLPEGDTRFKLVQEEKPKEFEDEHIGRPSGPQSGSTPLNTRKIYENQMRLARRP